MKAEIAQALAQHLTQALGGNAVQELGDHVIDDVAGEIAEAAVRLNNAASAEESAKIQREAEFIEEQALTRVDDEGVRKSPASEAALRGAIRAAIRSYLKI